MAAPRASSFGTLLREFRVAAGLTQEGLALTAGVSIRGISDLERGVNLAPRTYTLRRLAEALHLSPPDRALLYTAVRSAAVPGTNGNSGRGRKLGNFLGAEPSGRLVARLADLARIRLALEAAEGSSGRTILLAGEPGVGKTRLAQEAGLLAQDMSFLVAAGRCHEGVGRTPFYPFREALSTLYELAPDAVQRALPDSRPHLRLFLDAAGATAALPAREGEEQQQLFRTVTGFLRDVARLHSVALLFDDLHWADASSLRLLLHVARFTRGDRILLLGTLRPEAPVPDPDRAGVPDPVLQHVIGALHREEISERLNVLQLSHEETSDLIAEVLGAAVSPDLAGQVYRATAGNPFFIREVVRTLADRGDINREGNLWVGAGLAKDGERLPIDVPETVRAAISERLLRLDPTSQDILCAASVLGEQFTFEDLSAIRCRLAAPSADDRATTSAEIEVERALWGAASINLVHPVNAHSRAGHGEVTAPEGEHFAFNHALARHALYSGMSLHRRKSLHRIAAAALAASAGACRTGRVAERSWHAIQGGDRDQALPLVMKAGDQAEQLNANEEAVAHYQTGIRLARELGDRTQELEGLEKLGDLLRRMGVWSDALATAEALIELYHATRDADGEARAHVILGKVHRHWGTPKIGLERLTLVYPRLAAGASPPTVVRLRVALARLAFACSRYEESRHYAEGAAILARQLRGPGGQSTWLEAEAEVRWGSVLEVMGRSEEAREHLECGVRLAEGSDDPVLVTEGLNNLAVTYESLGRWEDLGRCAQRLLAAEERLNSACGMGWALMLAGVHACGLGAWQEARAYHERAAALFQEMPGYWFAPYAPLNVGELALDMGDRDEGLAALADALEKLHAQGNLPGIRQAEITLARLDLVEGRSGEAIRRLEAVCHGEEGETREVRFALPVLAEAYLESGDAPRAKQVLEQGANRAAEGMRGLLPQVFRVRAKIAAREQRWAAAECAFREALSYLESAYGTYDRARTLHDYGLMEVERGRAREARARLSEALSIFQRIGARPSEQRTAQALAALDAA
jgi:tetratricopeptide (TPR) repeat protein/transcriptional regulator with XRE-family HTH domain